MQISELKDPRDRAYAAAIEASPSRFFGNPGHTGQGPVAELGLSPLERFVCAIYGIDTGDPFQLDIIVEHLMTKEADNLYDYSEILKKQELEDKAALQAEKDAAKDAAQD